MRKLMKRYLVLALALLLGGGAASAATSSFTVSMVIRQAIAITKVTNLTFGTIELPTASTVYTVAAASTGHTAGVGATAAQFTVTGESGAPATASVAGPISIVSGANTLSVTPTLSASSFTFSATAQTIFVGGSVTVLGTTPTGTYSGNATLTVLYQ
jgi:hypothetical protein